MDRLPVDRREDVDRPVVAIANAYPAAFELAAHTHGRGQLIHAAHGVVVVSTPQGAWAAPTGLAVWIRADAPSPAPSAGRRA